MGTKNSPGKYDCYQNALPDEPMFVLLARDPSAPKLVSAWATIREQAIEDGARPKTDRALVEEADLCANAMEEWRKRNDGAWRQSRAQLAPPAPLPEDVEALAEALHGVPLRSVARLVLADRQRAVEAEREKAMAQILEFAQRWRDDAFDAAAEIAERYGSPEIADDIRALGRARGAAQEG